jgi:hypothetical protein
VKNKRKRGQRGEDNEDEEEGSPLEPTGEVGVVVHGFTFAYINQ